MEPSNVYDPAGDLVLEIGPDSQMIQVHSKVLSLASPVFAAMLSPKFAEGALGDNKSSNGSPAAICLPDDDFEAMSWLCGALHFQKRPAQRMEYVLLKKLAVLCDKYNMSKALSPWTEIWLSTCGLYSWETAPDYSNVSNNVRFERAWVSYALGHHDSFQRTMRGIVKNMTTAELATDTSLPDDVMGESSMYSFAVPGNVSLTVDEYKMHSELSTNKFSMNSRTLSRMQCGLISSTNAGLKRSMKKRTSLVSNSPTWGIIW